MEEKYLNQANYFMEESAMTENTEIKTEEVIEEKKEEKKEKEMDAETKKKVAALRKERDKLNDQIKKLTSGKDFKEGKLY